MCMNCGCGEPHERHGKAANLTLEDLRQAGAANDQSLRTTAGHIMETVDQVERDETTRSMSGMGEPADGLKEPAGARGLAPASRGTPGSES